MGPTGGQPGRGSTLETGGRSVVARGLGRGDERGPGGCETGRYCYDATMVSRVCRSPWNARRDVSRGLGGTAVERGRSSGTNAPPQREALLTGGA